MSDFRAPFEITQVSEPPAAAEEAKCAEENPSEKPVDESDTSAQIQRAIAQKVEAELSLRKLSVEQEIEKLEINKIARNQQLFVLVKQSASKLEELQLLKNEHHALDASASEKRLVLETLKTAIEDQWRQLTAAKNSVADLQTELRRLSESHHVQSQVALDLDRQIRISQQNQATIADRISQSEAIWEEKQRQLAIETANFQSLMDRLKQTQQLHESLFAQCGELEKNIHENKQQLAKIIADCRDQGLAILTKARQEAESLREETLKSAELVQKRSALEAQKTAADCIAQAEAAADKILGQAQMDGAQSLAKSRERSRILADEATAKTSNALAQAQTMSEELIQTARAEASAILLKAQNDSDQITLETRRRAEHLQHTAHSESQRLLSEAEEQRRLIIEEAQYYKTVQIDQVKTYTAELIASAEGRKRELQKDIDSISDYLHRERQAAIGNLERERHQLHHDIALERRALADRLHHEEQLLARQKGQLQEEFDSEKSALYRDVEIEKNKLDDRSRNLLQDVESQRQGLEASLNLRRQEFEKQLQQQKIKHDKELQDRTQKMSEEWQKKGEKIAKSLEQRGAELAEADRAARAKADQEIAELRDRTERDLVQQRIQQEAALQNWMRDQEDNFRTVQQRHRNQILDTIAAMAQTSLRSHIPPAEHSRFSHVPAAIRQAAEEAFLAAEKQTQALTQNMPKSGGSNGHFKDLSYWRGLLLHKGFKWGVVALALSVAAILWNRHNENQSMSAANSYVAEQLKKRKRLPFAPDQTSAYKTTYTDNVLYTLNYLKYEGDNGFRNRWIVALNRYGIDKLDMNNEMIVKLLSKEATMLKQLEKMKNEIDGKAPQPDIDRMREVEEKYRQQFVTIVGSRERFAAFALFKARYFEKALLQPLE